MKTKMLIRATSLTVSVAVVMSTTLMPRTATAALMCVPGGGSSINCTQVPGNCSSWGETSGASGPPWCFDANTVAASSKASAEMLKKRNASMKEGGMDPQALQQTQKEFMKAFDRAFSAGPASGDKGRVQR